MEQLRGCSSRGGVFSQLPAARLDIDAAADANGAGDAVGFEDIAES